MEPDPADPLLPPYEGGGTGDDKDPMKGVIDPGYPAVVAGIWRWIAAGGVWRWILQPLSGSTS